jgi:hypothetical protein
LLDFAIAEAVLVLATSCTSQITCRFMAASFERHVARSQLSAQPAKICSLLRKRPCCYAQTTAGGDLDAPRKKQRLNRVDLGAKDDVILTFAVMAHEPRVLGPLSAPHFEHTIANKHEESG